MKVGILVLSLVSALVLELVFGWRFAFFGVQPPLFFVVLACWWWNMPVLARYTTALTAGIFFDSISIFPFGVFCAAFGIVAGVAEVLRGFFSNVQSLLTQGLALGIEILIFFMSVSAGTVVISHVFGYPVSLGSFVTWAAVGVVVMWSVIVPFVWFGLRYIFDRR